VDAIAALFRDGRCGPLRLEELTPEAGLAAIERLALAPSGREMEVLGSIRHARDFDHTSHSPLVPADLPPCLAQTPAGGATATDWPVAAARTWLGRMPASAERDAFAARLRAELSYLDPRSLRQIA
jgi:hypothetical protein